MKIILALILFLINGISVLRFYQIKDYLLNRARAHFYLPSSKRLVFNLKEYILYLIFFSIFTSSFFIDFSNFSLRLDFLIFLLVLFFVLRFNFLKKINWTPKAILISLINLFLIFLFLFFFFHLLTIFLLSLWLVQFIFLTVSISIFDFLVKPYLNFLGKKVKEKIEENKNLKIIGIVGSYGKSSTKEILIQLLREKFKILTTPPRINHEYAILKFLLNFDFKNYDYLILEFGSYYLGNIKWLSQYIQPNIVFITGITKQHLFLFGNIENIIKGEGTEALENIDQAILFLNNNHNYFEKLHQEILKLNKNFQIYTYGLDADFSYQIIKQDLEKTIFKLKTKEKIFELETNLIFPMQIENLVGSLGFVSLIDDLENYREKIRNIELEEFLKLKKIDNLYIFDDSYNANLKGVLDSLNFFKKLDFDFKIIIFNGLFELGQEAIQIYEKLAQEFSNFDKIILTSNDYFEIFKKILKDKVLIINKQKELDIFLKTLKQKTGVWIINRFPSGLKLDEKVN